MRGRLRRTMIAGEQWLRSPWCVRCTARDIVRTSWTRAPLRLVWNALEGAAYVDAWWLFTGSSSGSEIVVGAAAVTLALIASHLVSTRLGARLQGNLGAIAQVWRVPALIVSGTFDLLKVLAKHLLGREKAKSLLRAVRFVHYGSTTSDQTFQALATAYTTISPNFVVIDVDPHARVLLFHQLAPTAVPKVTVKLGASP